MVDLGQMVLDGGIYFLYKEVCKIIKDSEN